jgi:hypothetical protein
VVVKNEGLSGCLAARARAVTRSQFVSLAQAEATAPPSTWSRMRFLNRHGKLKNRVPELIYINVFHSRSFNRRNHLTAKNRPCAPNPKTYPYIKV